MQTHTRRLLVLATVAVTVFALVGSTATLASAQAANEPTNATTVTVSASGEASGEPDVAVLQIESAATADTPSAAADRLASNTSQLRAALSETGVETDQRRTIYYSLDEVRPSVEMSVPRPPDNTSENVTYRARQGFEITVENTSRIGELVDVAVANGATAVLDVQFQLSAANRSQLRQQALEDAMGNARAQAETLARSESLSIVGVRSIAASDPFFGPVRTFEAAGGGAGTAIESGPLSVEVTVTVAYEAEAA